MAGGDVTLDGTPATDRHKESTGFTTKDAASRDAASPVSGRTDREGGAMPSADASDTSKVKANTAVIKSKPGPDTADNILHNYSNYTYKITLMAWKSIYEYNMDIQFGGWPLKENNKHILFSSGGFDDASVEINIAGMHGESGFREWSQSARRHPDFDVDFYISAFTTQSIMGMSGESRATNIFECDMKVTEPIGATLLERMYGVVTGYGRKNWGEYPLVVKIEFIGYDESGKASYIESAKRWIPVRLINMGFDVVGDGSTYDLSFVASTVIKKDHPRNIMLDATFIYGTTVKDFADDLARIFNKKQLERIPSGPGESSQVTRDAAAEQFRAREANQYKAGYKDYTMTVAPATQGIADSIEFSINEKIGNAKLVARVAEDTGLKAKFMEQQKKKVDAKGGDSTKGKEKTIEYRSIVDLDPNERKKIEVAKSTKQVAVIEKIIAFSTYITDQLKDPKQLLEGTTKNKLKKKEYLVDESAGLHWWKVTYVPIMKDWDDIRGQYGQHTIIQIEPYVVVDPITTSGICRVGEGAIAPAVRNYQYIYTGQNIDVKNFAISFNNAFIQSMLGQGTGNSKGQGIDPTLNIYQGSTGDEGQGLVAQKNQVMENQYKSTSNPDSKQKLAGTILENLYKRLGSDMMQCTIEIIGDPCYITQDGIVNLMTAKKAGYANGELVNEAADPISGACLSDHQDCHIFLSYKTPTDYNEEAGIMDFTLGKEKHRSSILSGYYRVWEVQNTFQNGEFTQSLNLTRVYNQWREQEHNSAAAGKSGGNDKSEFDHDIGNEAHFGAGAFKTSGKNAKTAGSSKIGSPKRKRELLVQQKALKDSQSKRIEHTELLKRQAAQSRGRESLVTSKNTEVANRNNINKQLTNERFGIGHAIAENRLTSPGIVQEASSAIGQIDTVADNINTRGNNADTLSQAFEQDTLVPTFSENAANPAFTILANQNTDGATNLRTSALLLGPEPKIANNIGVKVTSNNGNSLPVINKREGLYGTIGNNYNISTYSQADKTSIRANDNILRQQREAFIAASDSTTKTKAYDIANAASKELQRLHGGYGNEYKTWEQIGYFGNIV